MIVVFSRDTGIVESIYTDSWDTNLRESSQEYLRTPNNLKGLLLQSNRDFLSVNNYVLLYQGVPMFTFKEIQDHLIKIYTKRLSDSVPSNTAYIIDLIHLLFEGESVGIPLTFPMSLPSNIDGSLTEYTDKAELTAYYRELILTRMNEANTILSNFSLIGTSLLTATNQTELNSIGV